MEASRIAKEYKLIRSGVVSEGDDEPEARGTLRRQNEGLDEASRPTARAVAAEGGQTRHRSATTRTFCTARGGSEEV